jgi:sulfur carrier protein
MSMRVTVNGEPRELPPGTTLDRAVAAATGRPDGQATGVAAAVNGEVVPRGRWAAASLSDGDRIEVVTAVQGG